MNMIWSWKRKAKAAKEAELEEVARIIHQELTGRPEYKASLLISAALQETLRKLFGENGEAGSKDAVLCVVCEYLYCASCLTFSALSAADAATARERTDLITKWSVEAVEYLLLDPGFVFGKANAAFRQMWNTLADEKLRTERPSGYADPVVAVRMYVDGTLPTLAKTLMLDSVLEAFPYLYSAMEHLLETLVFTFPELFRPIASVIGGTVSATSGYGLGLVEHYSRLETRRAEREALRKAEQAAHCELASKIEKFVNSRRRSSG